MGDGKDGIHCHEFKVTSTDFTADKHVLLNSFLRWSFYSVGIDSDPCDSDLLGL